MDNPIIERDVVLIGKTEEGNDTFDFPVTRLGNIENEAEIKAEPGSDDYFPIIDSADGGKMKKTGADGIMGPLNSMDKRINEHIKHTDEHIEDNSRHITDEERRLWNSKPDSLEGFTLKSIQSYDLGAIPDYAYPTFTVPKGAEYYMLAFMFGPLSDVSRIYKLTGFHKVGDTAKINTSKFGYALYRTEGIAMGINPEYLKVSFESDVMKLSSHTDEAGDSRIKVYEEMGTVIQVVFF